VIKTQPIPFCSLKCPDIHLEGDRAYDEHEKIKKIGGCEA